MNAAEFVASLAAAAPSIEDLQTLGLSAKEAASFRKSFFVEPRKTSLALAEVNELFVLMSGWKAGTIEIGMVCFANAPKNTTQGVQVGVVEVDPLVIHANDELAVHELGTLEHVLWPVAKSPNDFLNALVVAANFLSDCSVEKIDFEDVTAAKSAAEQCANLAGGKRYLNFYLMLLGSE